MNSPFIKLLPDFVKADYPHNHVHFIDYDTNKIKYLFPHLNHRNQPNQLN